VPSELNRASVDTNPEVARFSVCIIFAV
jgi:hypothetical protein